MKTSGGCLGRSVVVGIGLIGVILILGLCGGLVWLRQQQDQARAQLRLPQVVVNNPQPGATAMAGSHASVTAMIYGGRPIVRAELWLDGALVASDTSHQSEGRTTVYSTLDVVVPQGYHLLFVRGIDTDGNIGQSAAVNIIGQPKPDRIFYSVPITTGETLTDVAHTYGTDATTLATLNPDLGGKEPDPGTRVIVPGASVTPSLSPAAGNARSHVLQRESDAGGTPASSRGSDEFAGAGGQLQHQIAVER